MRFLCDTAEIGARIHEWVKKFTKVKLNEINVVMGNHPSNTSKRLRNNNVKIEEFISLADYLQVPLQIKFGPIVAENEIMRREKKLREESLEKQLEEAMNEVHRLQNKLLQKVPK